jgi:polyisoprenoid-binding protein YceI
MSAIASPAATTAVLPLDRGTWVLDRTHSTVDFSVRHMAISKVRGTFHGVDAELVVGESVADSWLRATVALASIDTGNTMRDDHLRPTDFFSVATHPTMTFVSRTIVPVADGAFELVGDLTLNGVVREQRFAVQFLGTAVFPFDGSSHAGFTATGTLSRKAFGIDFNVPLGAGGVVIADAIEIVLDVQLMPAAQSEAYRAKFLPQG